MEVTETNTAVGMSAKDGTAVCICMFTESNYRQAELLLKVARIEYPKISVRDVRNSKFPPLQALLLMYGFHSFPSSLTAATHSGMSAEDIMRSLSGVIIVCRLVSNSGKKLLLLD